MSALPSQPMKRTAIMAELAAKAKVASRSRRHPFVCREYADEWVKLATVNDMVRAPKYLRWSGRIS